MSLKCFRAMLTDYAADISELWRTFFSGENATVIDFCKTM